MNFNYKSLNSWMGVAAIALAVAAGMFLFTRYGLNQEEEVG